MKNYIPVSFIKNVCFILLYIFPFLVFPDFSFYLFVIYLKIQIKKMQNSFLFNGFNISWIILRITYLKNKIKKGKHT